MPDKLTANFITSTFRSVWSLELLLHLRRARETSFRQEELVGRLRASESVVSRSIDALQAAGLIVEEDNGTVRYAPASEDLDRSVGEVERLYAVKPDTVRRTIVSGAGRGVSSGLAAFADAFRLKGD